MDVVGEAPARLGDQPTALGSLSRRRALSRLQAQRFGFADATWAMSCRDVQPAGGSAARCATVDEYLDPAAATVDLGSGGRRARFGELMVLRGAGPEGIRDGQALEKPRG